MLHVNPGEQAIAVNACARHCVLAHVCFCKPWLISAAATGCLLSTLRSCVKCWAKSQFERHGDGCHGDGDEHRGRLRRSRSTTC